MSRTSLAQYIAEFARHGRGIAFAHRRGYRIERWPYAEVVRVASQFARELESREVGQGDRVMIWGANCAEWAAAFFGCVLRGAVVVPMDAIAATDFAQRVAEQVDAKLVVASRECDALPFPTLVLEELKQSVAQRVSSLYPAPALTRDDVLQIVFTSGTTAEPKGVVISHGNVLTNLEPIENEIQPYLKYERIFHPLRFLNLLPLSHVFGQFMGLYVPPLLGAEVHFFDSLNPGEIIKLVKRERISMMISVPRMLQSLKDKIERDHETAGRLDAFRRDVTEAEGESVPKKFWRFRKIHRRLGWKFWAFISGGATLDSETEQFWGRLGYAVVQGYGLTETTSLISVNHPFRMGRGSIGKVLPGREIRLDPQTGEILVRGTNIAAGYWQGKELLPVTSGEGWFRTGDMGALDAQGNLYFKGRQKNVIVTSAGMKVYPEDLEAALRKQPEVRDCVVVGLTRDGNAEPAAAIIARGDASSITAAVARANASLAEFQRINVWTRWPDEDFPRTSTQKPRTNLILEHLQAQLSGAQNGAGLAANSPIVSPITDLIGRITRRPVRALDRSARLDDDLNLSSLDRVELMTALEDRYQVDLSDEKFTSAATIADLEKLLAKPEAAGELASSLPHKYPRWIRRWPVTWLRFIIYYALAWPATYLLARPKVIGRANLRQVNGPVLVISNHIEYVDAGFVLFALPFRIRRKITIGMSGEMLRDIQQGKHGGKQPALFRRWLGQIVYYLVISIWNVFPLPQRSQYLESFAFAGESADRGYSVLVFPEGRRTPDGKLHGFKSGIGVLANNLALPVVPVKIEGLWELKAAGKRGFARAGDAIRVKIGAPVQFAAGTDPEHIARELHNAVAAL